VTEEPSVAEFTVYQNAGDTIRIIPTAAGAMEIQPRVPPEEYKGAGLGVHWIEVEGPVPLAAGQFHPAARQVSLDKGTLADAEIILRRFVPKAFRRPVSEDEIELYVALVGSLEGRTHVRGGAAARAEGGAVQPGFPLLEASPAGSTTSSWPAGCPISCGAPCPTIRSWSWRPKGAWHAGYPSAQVERMLNDPRAHAFTESFTGQWLKLRDVFATTPEMNLYRDYDDLLGQSMVRETHLFFEEMLKCDRSLLEFVHSDWSFLNERLAQHYGIAGVKGHSFRKVDLPANSHRGGVLTQASVLKVTANGPRPRRCKRGAFVLGQHPGTPLRRPQRRGGDRAGFTRAQPHIRAQPPSTGRMRVATCHAKIDPPGFAPESFDVIGLGENAIASTPVNKSGWDKHSGKPKMEPWWTPTSWPARASSATWMSSRNSCLRTRSKLPAT
jgi:hypothetical protein